MAARCICATPSPRLAGRPLTRGAAISGPLAPVVAEDRNTNFVFPTFALGAVAERRAGGGFVLGARRGSVAVAAGTVLPGAARCLANQRMSAFSTNGAAAAEVLVPPLAGPAIRARLGPILAAPDFDSRRPIVLAPPALLLPAALPTRFWPLRPVGSTGGMKSSSSAEWPTLARLEDCSHARSTVM